MHVSSSAHRQRAREPSPPEDPPSKPPEDPASSALQDPSECPSTAAVGNSTTGGGSPVDAPPPPGAPPGAPLPPQTAQALDADPPGNHAPTARPAVVRKADGGQEERQPPPSRGSEASSASSIREQRLQQRWAERQARQPPGRAAGPEHPRRGEQVAYEGADADGSRALAVAPARKRPTEPGPPSASQSSAGSTLAPCMSPNSIPSGPAAAVPPGILLNAEQQRHWTPEQLQAYVLAQQMAMIHAKAAANRAHHIPSAPTPPLRPGSAVSSARPTSAAPFGAPHHQPQSQRQHQNQHQHPPSASSNSGIQTPTSGIQTPTYLDSNASSNLYQPSSASQGLLTGGDAPSHPHSDRAIYPVGVVPPSRGGVHTPQAQQLHQLMKEKVAGLLGPSPSAELRCGWRDRERSSSAASRVGQLPIAGGQYDIITGLRRR